jgi:hypothetical protein
MRGDKLEVDLPPATNAFSVLAILHPPENKFGLVDNDDDGVPSTIIFCSCTSNSTSCTMLCISVFVVATYGSNNNNTQDYSSFGSFWKH